MSLWDVFKTAFMCTLGFFAAVILLAMLTAVLS